MSERSEAKFRATTESLQGFGTTPQEALIALMQRLSGDAATPIVIWPYNRGDAFFTDAQQARLQELKMRRDSLTLQERAELESLVAFAFDATIARTQALPLAKS